MSQYHANQLSNIDAATRTEFDRIKIQVSCAGIKTNHMNITEEAYAKIRGVLISMNNEVQS